MSIKYITIFLVALFQTSAEGGELSFQKYMSNIKENDKTLKVLMRELEQAKLTLNSGLSLEGYLMKVEAGKELEGDDSEITAGVAKSYSSIGVNVSAQYSVTTTEGSDTGGMSFRLEKSLIKNLTGNLYKNRLDQLSAEEQKNIFIAEEKIEDYLVVQAEKYFDFTKAYLDLELAKKLVKDINRLEKFAQKKLNAGSLNTTDLNRIKIQVIVRREELLTAQKSFDDLAKDIFTKTAVDSESFFPEKELKIDTYYPETDLKSVTNYRDYLIAKSTLEESWYFLSAKESETYPELSFVVEKALDERGPSDQSSFIGLNFSVDLGDEKSKAEFANAKLKVEKSQISLEEKSVSLKFEYDVYSKEAVLLRKKIALSKEKVLLIRSIFEDETRRYEIGKIDLDDMIQISNQFAKFQYEYNALLVDYNYSKLKLIDFQDGLYN